MKTCPCCKNQLEDNALYCPVCGTTQASSIPNRPVEEAPVYQPPIPQKDPYDHTDEFDQSDIAHTKLLCMAAYLLDFFGVIIALLAAKESPYAAFHVRQSLKYTILEVLITLVSGLLVWTFLVPLAGGIALMVLAILKLVSFAQVCRNEAKEPPIIRSLTFLN